MKITTNITYQSVLAGIINIEERNKVFNSLDPEIQRKEIAWDALQLVISGSVGASYCEYWSNELNDLRGDSKQFQNTLLNNLPECRVCQRGLMMLSQIRLGNELSSSTLRVSCGSSDIVKGFSMDSFNLMENEFEGGRFHHPYETNTNSKLANICCNILANGDFNIHDKTDYLIVNEQAGS